MYYFLDVYRGRDLSSLNKVVFHTLCMCGASFSTFERMMNAPLLERSAASAQNAEEERGMDRSAPSTNFHHQNNYVAMLTSEVSTLHHDIFSDT